MKSRVVTTGDAGRLRRGEVEVRAEALEHLPMMRAAPDSVAQSVVEIIAWHAKPVGPTAPEAALVEQRLAHIEAHPPKHLAPPLPRYFGISVSATTRISST